MCLTVNKVKKGTGDFNADVKLVTKIAKEDILVYKTFKGGLKGLITPFQNHNWSKFGVESVKEFDGTSRVSYADPSHHTLGINEGIHANTSRADAKSYNSYGKIVEMVIPAGTPYILNNSKTEIVALSMKVYRSGKPKALKIK